MSYQPPDYGQQPQQPPYVPGPPTQPSRPPDAYPPPPQPFSAPPQYGAPYPPPRPAKRKTGKVVLITVGSVVALVLVVCVIGAVLSAGDPDNKVKVQPPATAQAAKGGAAQTTEPADEDTADSGDSDSGKTFDVPIGSTITITGDDGSAAEATLRSVKTYKKACGGFGPDPDNGMFVVVDIVVKQTKGTGSVNPLYFTFVGDDGATANGISGAFSGCDKPSLSSTNSLHAGQKRSGKIAFDATSRKGSVEWAPGGLGADTVGSWKVG